MKEKLNNLIKSDKAKGSHFYIIPVSAKDIRRMRSITGRKPKDLDYWLGERLTMFF